MKNRLSQMVFQRFDLKGQRGGRDAKLLGRLGEGHMPRGSFKGAKGGKGRKTVRHFS